MPLLQVELGTIVIHGLAASDDAGNIDLSVVLDAVANTRFDELKTSLEGCVEVTTTP